MKEPQDLLFAYSDKTSTSYFTHKDDVMLWQEFKLGSKEAFSSIYHRYFNDLYLYGLKIAFDQDLVKDRIQELFLHLWLSRERLGDVGSIKYYLLKSYRRILINSLKSSKEESVKIKAFTKSQPDITFSSQDFLVAEETFQMKRETLSKILNELPKRRKEAIYLRYYRDLSYEEIAIVMNLTEKAVINHIYKAFKSIRKKGTLKKVVETILKATLLFLLADLLQ